MPKEVRDYVVNVRVTQSEREKVERLSERLNMTWSSYVQFLIQKAPNVPNKGYKK